MRTDQALFPLGIEPDISQVHPWEELLATGGETTWLIIHEIYSFKTIIIRK